MVRGVTFPTGQRTEATGEQESRAAGSVPPAPAAPPPPPRSQAAPRVPVSALQNLLVSQARALRPAPQAGQVTAASRTVTDGESSSKPVASARKTWQISADPAIHQHQGGGYKTLTSFALTLKDNGIPHYSNNIEDKAAFVAAWREKARDTLRMNTEQVDSINEEKIAEVVGTLTSIDKEWAGYPVSTEAQTFRGDGLSIADSFPWLQDIVKRDKGDKVTRIDLDVTETSPTIMSTSADKDCSYAKNATILWKFSLPEGQHQGISKPIYASEDEVTFPIYNEMNIKSVTCIPKGQSFDAGFGQSHRYVIEAEMRPKPGAPAGSASAG